MIESLADKPQVINMKKASKARTANQMHGEESEYTYVSFLIITLAHLSSDKKQKVMKLADNVIPKLIKRLYIFK